MDGTEEGRAADVGPQACSGAARTPSARGVPAPAATAPRRTGSVTQPLAPPATVESLAAAIAAVVARSARSSWRLLGIVDAGDAFTLILVERASGASLRVPYHYQHAGGCFVLQGVSVNVSARPAPV